MYTHTYKYKCTQCIHDFYSPEIPIVLLTPGSPSPAQNRAPRPARPADGGLFARGFSGAPRWQVGERLGGWKTWCPLVICRNCY